MDDNSFAAEARKHFEQDQAQSKKDEKILAILESSLHMLRLAKPDERGELTRRYAVTITEFEKILAYFKTFVIDNWNDT